jgi:hypothetical protein
VGELQTDLGNVPLQLRIFVFAVLGQDLGMLFLRELNFLLLGHAEQ